MIVNLWDREPEKAGGRITPHLIISDDIKAVENKGCVIVCPGGAYAGRALYEGEPVAQWLEGEGIRGVTLMYNVNPYAYPNAYLEIQRAIRYIRYNAYDLGVNPDKIGVLGFSAGGHLSAYAGTHFDYGISDSTDPIDRVSCRPDAMVLCYPLISFIPNSELGCLKLLLNREPTEQDIYNESLEMHVRSDSPPAFIWHTSEDMLDVRNSLKMGAALREQKIPFELHVFPYGPHGMTLGNGDKIVSQWTGLCIKWFETLGFK